MYNFSFYHRKRNNKQPLEPEARKVILVPDPQHHHLLAMQQFLEVHQGVL